MNAETLEKAYEIIDNSDFVKRELRKVQLIKELAKKIETLPGIKKENIGQIVFEGLWNQSGLKLHPGQIANILGPEYGPVRWMKKR